MTKILTYKQPKYICAVVCILLGLALLVRSRPEAIRFDTLVTDVNLRLYDVMVQPEIVVVATPSDIQALAHTFAIDPRIDDQRARAIERLQQLDYHHIFALIVTREYGDHNTYLHVQNVSKTGQVVQVRADFGSHWQWPLSGHTPDIQAPFQIITFDKTDFSAQPLQFNLLREGKVVATIAKTILAVK